MDEKYRCPKCNNDTFQEVGSVTTTTVVEISVGVDGKPIFENYSDLGSDCIWDASEGHYIECRHCLTTINAEGYEAEDPSETLAKRNNALAEIASGVPVEDEWESAADFMEHVAGVLVRYGIPRPDHYED